MVCSWWLFDLRRQDYRSFRIGIGGGLLELLELSGPAWCTVPRFPFDDAEDLLDACSRLGQEGIVLKRLDTRYVPGVRTDAWREVKTSAWRTDHGPRRLPKEIRERIEQER